MTGPLSQTAPDWTSMATLEDLQRFVADTAHLPKDGELVNGSALDMENDHAYETLHRLISGARELIGMKDPE